MQNDTMPKAMVFFSTPVIDELGQEREFYIYLQNQLDYMASRLRAALHAFANQNNNRDNGKWWLEGFRYEIVRDSLLFCQVPAD